MSSTRTHPAAAEATQPLPPHNLDAEASVLGAMLLSPRAIEAVAQVVDAADFYRGSNGRIYSAALTLHQLGQPVDAITVAERLDELGQLEDLGDGHLSGKERIHELAALVPATGNAAHHARIVADMAQLRQLTAAGEQIQRLGYDRPGPTGELLEQAREIIAGLDARVGGGQPLAGGLNHQDVLDLDIAADRYLIDDLIPAGAVGTIAAVPESHKSWLAQAIAIRIARGHGYVLGKQVTNQGPVAYFWQDDSTREEAERVKAFETVHPTDADADTPVTWFLNTGVQLPRDLPRLRTTVEQGGYALLVLDSYYNFLPGVDLKDEQAEQIIALLKREISDATGCTVLIVDHMPWATEQNRGRLRAYGGVFKNAATRFGIYIDAVGDKLHIEARGNNIKGIPKRLAYWDADQLELRLLNTTEIDRDDLVTARMVDVRAWLEENPGGHTGKEVRVAVGGKVGLTDEALEALKAEGHIQDQGHSGGSWSGKRGATRYWIASIHAPQRDSSTTTPLFGVEVGRGVEVDRPVHYDPDNRDEVGRSQSNPTPGTQDDLDSAPKAPPRRGVPTGVEVQAPHQTTSTQRRDEVEAWLRSEGWMHDDPAAALIDRWPMLPVAEIKRLTLLSAELAGEGLVETPDLMEGE